MERKQITLPIEPAEQIYWSNYYARLLRKTLRSRRAYALQNSPQVVRSHFESFLSALHEARYYPTLYPLALELVETLHPWPTKWGLWEVWGKELRFALEVAQQQVDLKRQVYFFYYLTETLMRMGDYDAALEQGDRAFKLAAEQNLVVVLVDIGFNLIEILRSQDKQVLLQECYSKMIACVEAARPFVAPQAWYIAWSRLTLRSMWNRLGDYRQAAPLDMLPTLQNILTQLSTMEAIAVDILLDIYFYASLLYRRWGDFENALYYLKRKIRLATENGEQFALENDSGNLSLIYYKMYCFDYSEKYLEIRVAWCRQSNDLWFLMRSLGYSGLVYVAKAEFQMALRQFEEQMALAQQLGDQESFWNSYINQANTWLALGQYQQAVEALEQWVATQPRVSVGVAAELVSLSQGYAGLGKLDYARQLAEEAADVAQRFNHPILHIIARKHVATFLPIVEQYTELRQVLDEFAFHYHPIAQADCLLALAKISDAPERQCYWARAVQLLTEMGSAGWLRNATMDNPPLILAMSISRDYVPPVPCYPPPQEHID